LGIALDLANKKLQKV